MKLRALIERSSVISLLTVLVCSCPIAARASNAVCPAPVGGQVTCEDGQLAFCRVNKGSGVEAGCRTPPKNLNAKETNAWTLSQVLGREVTVDDAGKQAYANILRTGSANVDGSAVMFKLPTEVMDKLQKENIERERPQNLKQNITPENIKPDKIKPEMMKEEKPKSQS